MNHEKSYWGALGLASILIVGTIFYNGMKSPNQTSTTPKENFIIEEINADHMYETVAYLSEQPRAAGTEGEKRAVDYIEKQFNSLGYETEVQEFPVYDFIEKHVSVKLNGQELEDEIRAFKGAVSGQATGPLVHVGKATLGELGEDINGKVVLIERGEITFIEKLQNVIDKGAVGVIMYNDNPSGSFIGAATFGQHIPAVAVSRELGLYLVEQANSGKAEVNLDVEVEEDVLTSYNVIASLKPKKNQNTGQIVTIGAHHDSVPAVPGANDNASGVSAVLELARIFAKTPIDTEVRFLTFGAEEMGLIGSSHYVSTLPQDEIDRMVAHFQMDMIGAAAAGGSHVAGGLIMYTIDGNKNLVTDLGAEAAKQIISEVIPYGQLGRSDHQPFHDVGIASALFIHSPVEPDYHQPTDTLDKISKEKLQQVAEIVGTAVYDITNTESPKVDKENTKPATVEYEFEKREL